MTNAEKYKEVFGMDADPTVCPTLDCKDCPCSKIDAYGDVACITGDVYKWWNQTYKGVNND